MIPKTIHYCWFGCSPKPEIIDKCIASWRKYCPDYEIIEWNEGNYDVNKSVFMREAYEAKKWAFVSDYARIDIVNQHGGIYLDTDVELKSSLDAYLKYDSFFFWETARYINSGMGFGSQPDYVGLKRMIEFYDSHHFDLGKRYFNTPCPDINTEAVLPLFPSLIRNGQTQIIDNVAFISGCEYSIIAKHYSTGLWDETKTVQFSNRSYKPSRLKSWLRQPGKFDWINKHFGKKAEKLYTLIAYDVVENGLFFYIKRKL